jgi:glyoxylase-like metal-dependent hydrolase (beta-lactamase superfamily II)
VKKTVSSLGSLKYIVALDIEHHIFLTPWSKAYPEAKLIAMEGLPEKREKNPETAGLTFSTIYTAKQQRDLKVSDEFDAEFEVEYMPSHANKEVVVFHKPSKTLITADLFFNLPATEQYSKTGIPANTGFLTRIFAGIMNTKGDATWQKRFLWYAGSKADRAGFAASIARIDKWDFERIIPCHGDVIETDGKAIFEKVMEWHLTKKN